MEFRLNTLGSSSRGERRVAGAGRQGVGRAFTLVELMVSIAIALLLMIGINQVFSIAQKTTGAGNQLSQAVRDNRSFQGRIYQDARGMVIGDAPFFTIIGQAHPAFRTKVDQANSPNPKDPTSVNNPFGGAPIRYSLAAVNDRIHRIDRLMFFDRDVFQRQTGNDFPPTLSSPTSSYEAYVWYGHLALPNNYTMFSTNPVVWNPTRPEGGNWFNPGEPDRNTTTGRNDNNFFATDWILGRQAMLLVLSPPPLPSNSSKLETAIYPQSGEAPLAMTDRFVGRANNSTRTPIYASRFDMAVATIDGYRQFVTPRSAPEWTGTGPNSRWLGWQWLTYATTNFNRPGDTGDARFYGNPFLRRSQNSSANANLAQQYLAAGAAQSAPILVRGCTQFIVEYAGKFLYQHENAALPGGAIDPNFGQVVGTWTKPPASPTELQAQSALDFIPERLPSGQWTRRTRWYGFPRRIGTEPRPGDNASHVAISLTIPPGQQLNNPGSLKSPDVLPLRDVLASLGVSGADLLNATPFERRFPTNGTISDYGTSNAFGAYSPSAPDPLYVCSWGPDCPTAPKPKLLRITIAIDDPATRLPDPQTYEYVIELP